MADGFGSIIRSPIAPTPPLLGSTWVIGVVGVVTPTRAGTLTVTMIGTVVTVTRTGVVTTVTTGTGITTAGTAGTGVIAAAHLLDRATHLSTEGAGVTRGAPQGAAAPLALGITTVPLPALCQPTAMGILAGEATVR